MTTIQSNPSAPALACSATSVQVCWSSTRMKTPDGAATRSTRRRFMLEIEPAGRDHAWVQAWIEQDRDRHVVFSRQSLVLKSVLIDRVMHMDVRRPQDQKTLAAISMLIEERDQGPTRLLYAQSTLLKDSDFPAGSYDPPSLVRHAHANGQTAA